MNVVSVITPVGLQRLILKPEVGGAILAVASPLIMRFEGFIYFERMCCKICYRDQLTILTWSSMR